MSSGMEAMNELHGTTAFTEASSRRAMPDGMTTPDAVAIASKLTFFELIDKARRRVHELCERRGWSTSPLHRLGSICSEASELDKAVRGKGGDTLTESANVLFALLAASPHELEVIVRMMHKQIDDLWNKPPYHGEDRER